MNAGADHGGWVALEPVFARVDSVAPAIKVRGLAMHSGRVVPKGLFLACAGARHGLDFLPQALQRGASAVAWEPVGDQPPPACSDRVRQFAVPGLRGKVGPIADAYYAHPSQDLSMACITGTNGKTTVAWLAAHAMNSLGRSAAAMGTLGWGRPEYFWPSTMTTPDPDELHRRLRVLADGGIKNVFLEVSSQGLDQQRINGLPVRLAAFTHLGRDHLDYHGHSAAYAEAKQRLFLEHRPEVSVINVDDPFGAELARRCRGRVLSVACEGRRSPADLSLVRSLRAPAGLRLELEEEGRRFELASRLHGGFNSANLALAFGLLRALGIGGKEAAEALSKCPPPPGRMEHFGGGALPDAFVDFAHTPEALSAALGALKARNPHRLWCVMGCGGERDEGKRAEMGRVAGSMADELFITSDNPRGEDPREIAAQVLAGVSGQAVLELDRGSAIRKALHGAQRGDIVLVAGKGHEAYQVSGGRVLPFSDASAVREALAAWPGAAR
ncbi:MAG: UDP-N-acetylmuramoyl-L-alanyl-D-glutamate--2,6-diaminopimelate ligase [Gammaproteobacteria bacterium]|nr:UDP-N-acetylmuramoyl-L-alanyl-D-glutamate--2,6-diaminopimelate ligase [Gammaproteobacteria bacterium]MCY4165084.1 UDP-N-acetylmuramoyl-L-alanyl-D-glutamate--2,6-diaminopimelate ligase [Gammaproteobacteria bacterium]MCY4255567.1 UDP-N-acetylmuramoyl-L-alanyl-D-glutamate--2,6-diaminopimelate ligase [Gammaproteobacteria bacterium]MCY4341497.1 UDP-N-acetylmuramoyl-L-alanyl-D-glutamate--2,6-diaminopimelate ligase [Gammaproteobacteria bacterium]